MNSSVALLPRRVGFVRAASHVIRPEPAPHPRSTHKLDFDHLKAIYDEGELQESATCKEHLQVRSEGARKVSRSLKHYSLEAIIAVGYRVRSPRGSRFATRAGGAALEVTGHE